MPNFKHILFPVDFSQQCCNVAPYVLCMARRYGAHVSMLHVMELPTGAYPGWPAPAAVIDFQEMADERKKRLEGYLKNEFAEVAQTRLLSKGDPSHAITDYAQKEHVDLVMMPTHGYGPFRRFLLGSVTAKVLHDVKCPVWTSAIWRKLRRRLPDIATFYVLWISRRKRHRWFSGLRDLRASKVRP